MWNCGKRRFKRKQSKQKEDSELSGLLVSVCVSNALLQKLTSWAAHTRTHTITNVMNSACTHNEVCFFRFRRRHSWTQGLPALKLCPWTKKMDAHSTQTATPTHANTHTQSACTNTRFSKALHREVNRRVWHPLASCASNAAEKQLNKLQLWQLWNEVELLKWALTSKSKQFVTPFQTICVQLRTNLMWS